MAVWTSIFSLLLLTTGTWCQEETPSGPTQPQTASNCNQWYTVKAGDSCYSVETDFKISHADFLKWNPSVSEDCVTNFWTKYSYCVGIGDTTTSKKSFASSTSSLTSSTPGTGAHGPSSTAKGSKTGSSVSTSTTADSSYSIRNPVTSFNISTPTIDRTWPPKRTQAGQPSYCNRWYLVEAGDTCDVVYQKFGTSMTKEQLLQWNPSLDDDCSGLYYGWWVCVGAQPRSSLTLTWSSEAGNVTVPSYEPFTPTAFPSINSSFTATPTNPGLASDCKAFYSATADDTCTKVLSQYDYVSRDEFFKWNPALNGNCDGLWAHYWYCVAAWASQELPMPPTVTKAPEDVPTGATSSCIAWYQMTGTDTCESIAAMFGTFSSADFIKWNPAVWSDCSNIKEESWYCVAVPDTPKTRTSLPSRPPVVSAATTTSQAALAARGLGAVAMPTKI